MRCLSVILSGFFNSYASGLTCYMFFSNLINILQTIITRKFIFDDEKIRKELDLRKTSLRKGGFQSPLEKAMKQQQRLAEEKAKNKKSFENQLVSHHRSSYIFI